MDKNVYGNGTKVGKGERSWRTHTTRKRPQWLRLCDAGSRNRAPPGRSKLGDHLHTHVLPRQLTLSRQRLNQSTVDIQCCISFRCNTEWVLRILHGTTGAPCRAWSLSVTVRGRYGVRDYSPLLHCSSPWWTHFITGGWGLVVPSTCSALPHCLPSATTGLFLVIAKLFPFLTQRSKSFNGGKKSFFNKRCEDSRISPCIR